MGNLKVAELAAKFNQINSTISDSSRRVQLGRAKTAASFGNTLNLEKLVNSGIATSNNPLLQRIWGTALNYNRTRKPPETLSTEVKYAKIIELDALMYWTAEYRLAKATVSVRRDQRLDGLEELVQSTVQELGLLGVRAMNDPVMRDDASVWAERLDPQHRSIDVLTIEFDKWTKTRPVHSGGLRPKQMSFVEFLTSSNSNGPNVKYDAMHEPDWSMSVYFDKNGNLRDATSTGLMSTRASSTAHSGSGWAIFVASPLMSTAINVPQVCRKAELYFFSGSHSRGTYHHSSFLSGAPVAAAGEWIVVDGRIKVMTPKSGHYLPTDADMVRLIHQCPAIPNSAYICPDWKLRFKGEPYFTQVGYIRDHGWTRCKEGNYRIAIDVIKKHVSAAGANAYACQP